MTRQKKGDREVLEQKGDELSRTGQYDEAMDYYNSISKSSLFLTPLANLALAAISPVVGYWIFRFFGWCSYPLISWNPGNFLVEWVVDAAGWTLVFFGWVFRIGGWIAALVFVCICIVAIYAIFRLAAKKRELRKYLKAAKTKAG